MRDLYVLIGEDVKTAGFRDVIPCSLVRRVKTEAACFSHRIPTFGQITRRHILEDRGINIYLSFVYLRTQVVWEQNIKMFLTETGWEGVDSINMAQDTEKCCDNKPLVPNCTWHFVTTSEDL